MFKKFFSGIKGKLSSIIAGNNVRSSVVAKGSLQSIVDCIDGSVFWKDREGRYLGCNQFVLNMAGLDSLDEIIGKTDYDLPWKDSAKELQKTDLTLIKSKKKITLEEEILTVSGKSFFALSQKAPLYDNNKKIIGVVGVGIDISELKETQKTLEAALEDAQVANKVRDAIVANMRHDMNTPFSALYSLAAALAESEEDPERKEQQECVAEGAEFMLQHITKILSLIGAAEGSPPVASEPLDLAGIVSRVFNIYKLTAKEKGIESKLVCENDARLVKLTGDRFRIECFLMAILDNAIKFTGKNGAVKLGLHVEKIKESGPQTYVYVRFEIDDTGIGMDDEVLRQMHEPMYRANPAYNAKYAGAGTGLTIAKKYIEDMEGQILCKSSPGDGSKFVIIIPFALPYADDANEFVAG